MNLSQDLQISVSVAASEAANRRHEFIGLEHLLYALLHDELTAQVVTGCGANVQQLKAQLDTFLADNLESMPQVSPGIPAPTIALQRVLSRAAGAVERSGKTEVLGQHVLLALFSEPESWALHFLEQAGIRREDVMSVLARGPRQAESALPSCGSEAGDDDDTALSTTELLELYTKNLNQLAAAGELDPLVGRGAELERAVHVLCRRRKNHPLFVGDAGVGKTAIVEGLAQQIVKRAVPEPLAGATIFSLDLGALLAGTRYRGDFEQRVKQVTRALADYPGAILFIDELHSLVGTGAAGAGAMDAATLLKPVLARGELRCIGATSYADYRAFVERDSALLRRFQKIDVTESTVDETVQILERLRSRFESHHQVKYSRAALVAAAQLSAQYLPDRRLPDKAIDVIDEAGAAVRLSRRRGVRVTRREVEAVFAKMASLPERTVRGDDRERLRQLEPALRAQIYGQDHAVEQIAAAVKMSRAGLAPAGRPAGSFLLTGPTGVGKTELARKLAEVLGLKFLRFDMSEYMERHAVSRLIGAPPGYVGFDQGGLLTEAIRKTPHAVLLLDEVEKAHPDLFNLLLQVMDHGTLTDNNGQEADFRHVLILMTSNIGARELERRPVGFGGELSDSRPGEDEELRQFFSPEFRNRLDGRIRFRHLSPEVMVKIVDKLVAEVQVQLAPRGVRLALTESAESWLAEHGYDERFGARPLGRLIQQKLRRPLADMLLFGELAGAAHGLVSVDATDERGLVIEFAQDGPRSKAHPGSAPPRPVRADGRRPRIPVAV